MVVKVIVKVERAPATILALSIFNNEKVGMLPMVRFIPVLRLTGED